MSIAFPYRRWLLIFEFALLCIVLPGVIIVFRLAPYMFTFLWGAALYSFIVLRCFEKVSLRDLWRWEALTWAHLRPILARFSLCTVGMIGFCLWYDPDRFLFLPQTNPTFVLILCCLYPVISALPQELIFCSFFFKRYGVMFGTTMRVMIASAVVFSFAHVLYINWVAPMLSLIAGLIFADTYRRYHSLALVTIEHGLYGNVLFIIGLGWYFYGGAVQ